MTVRRLRANESALFKTLRLRALADAPVAFASSFADAGARPDAWWDEVTRSVTEPGRHAMFLAEEGAAPAVGHGGQRARARPRAGAPGLVTAADGGSAPR